MTRRALISSADNGHVNMQAKPRPLVRPQKPTAVDNPKVRGALFEFRHDLR